MLDADLLVAIILIGNDDKVVRAERIDLDLAELAGRDLILEENIEIGVGETLVEQLV